MKLFYLVSFCTILLNGLQSFTYASVRNGTIELMGVCNDALVSSYHSFEVESGPFELRRLLDEMISFRKSDFIANLQALYPELPSAEISQSPEDAKKYSYEERLRTKLIGVAPSHPFARYNEMERSGALPYSPTEAFYLTLVSETQDVESGFSVKEFDMSIPPLFFHNSRACPHFSLNVWPT